MTFQIFSIWGYLSMALWLAGPVLWWLHFRRQPRRWLCHYAVVAALLALVFAQINSQTHVKRLQVDQSEVLAAAQARQAEARRMAEEQRADDVAKIRFAEDGSADFLDLAGLDEADLRFIGTLDDSVTPEWRQRRERGAARSPMERRSLDDILDTMEPERGMNTAGMEEEPRVMMLPQRKRDLALRLNALNLQWIRLFLLGAVGVVIYDYLVRVNRYVDAYCPLPLPSVLTNSVTPLPTSWSRGESPRRSVPSELEWIVRRGDVFVWLTDHPASAAEIPSCLPQLPNGRWPMDVIHVAAEDALVSDSFVFEGLWYNRACFVIDSPDRAAKMLAQFAGHLSERMETRAQVRQTVHIVWDMQVVGQPDGWDDLVWLAGNAGMCVWSIPATTLG